MGSGYCDRLLCVYAGLAERSLGGEVVEEGGIV